MSRYRPTAKEREARLEARVKIVQRANRLRLTRPPRHAQIAHTMLGMRQVQQAVHTIRRWGPTKKDRELLRAGGYRA